MGHQPIKTKPVYKLNTEQLETIINSIVSYMPLSDLDRINLLDTLFTTFLIPCVDITLNSDTMESIPSIDTISTSKDLKHYFFRFNNLMVRIKSRKRKFIAFSPVYTYEIVSNGGATGKYFSFGDSFTIPEEMCKPGLYTMLNMLYYEYLFVTGRAGNIKEAEAMVNIIRSYLKDEEIWNSTPDIIKKQYSYMDPMTPEEIFKNCGYPPDAIIDILLIIKEIKKEKK